MWRKILKAILILAGTLVTAVFCLVALVIGKPNLVLNDRTMDWAKRLVAKTGVEIHWKVGHLEVLSHSLLEKHLQLTAENLCVRFDQSKFCATTLDLKAGVRITWGIPLITFVGPVRLTQGSVQIGQAPLSETRHLASSERQHSLPVLPFPFPSEVPSWIASADFRGASLEVPLVKIALGSDTLLGDAQIEAAHAGEAGSEWSVNYHLQILPEKNLALEGTLDATSLHSPWTGPWKLALKSTGQTSPDLRVSAKLEGTQETNESFPFLLKATVNPLKQGSIQISARGDFSPVSVKMEMDAKMRDWASNVPELAASHCQLSLLRKKHSDRATLSLNCPLTLEVRTYRKRMARFAFLKKDWDRIDIGVRANLDTSFPPDPSLPFKGDVKVDLSPLKNPFVSASGGALFQVNGTIADFPDKLGLTSQIDAGITVEHFEHVVRLMSQFPKYAIPEPFRSLKGTIALRVKNNEALPWKIQSLPFTLQTRLKSASQSLDIDSEGKFTIDQRKEPRYRLETEVTLSDVKLVLPYLDPTARPRLLPDTRIRIPEREVNSQTHADTQFSYKVRVRTPLQRPLRLTSNLAKADIPIELELLLEDEKPPKFTVKIAEFPVKLFERNAKVEHFSLKSSQTNKAIFVDGLADVTYTDYVVHIRVLGTTSHPSVDLTSTPPLPNNQVVAVLLFGRPLDQLDPGQMDSVGSARAAFADGAISLASMYLLASTPIESVGYDPSTGIMSAKLKLGDGASFNVGTDFTQVTQLGVRKRLGPNWSVSTYLDNPFESVTRALSAYLEWNKNY